MDELDLYAQLDAAEEAPAPLPKTATPASGSEQGGKPPTASESVVAPPPLAKESELDELQQQVASMEEDHQLAELHRKAEEEEGTRKTAVQAVSTSVFLRGMDPRATERDITVFFDGCGTLKRITILKDRTTGQSRGQAYVEFETEEAMNKALLRNNNSCYGRPVNVVVKRENVPNMGRGGRGAGLPVGRGGTGGRGGAAAMNLMMQMMQFGGQNFAPFGRGRGGRGGGRGQY